MAAEEALPGPSGEHVAPEVTEADLLAADRDFAAGIQALKVCRCFISRIPRLSCRCSSAVLAASMLSVCAFRKQGACAQAVVVC